MRTRLLVLVSIKGKPQMTHVRGLFRLAITARSTDEYLCCVVSFQ